MWWALFGQVLFLISGAWSTCVHVPNQDMIEYSCTGGSPSDLYAIPERTEKIRITNMTIPRITRETFSRYGENLWVLTCTHCGIKDIDSDAFESLVNLQQLRLDNNHLRDVRAAWFVAMKYLTYLDLNYNEIERIEDAVYTNLPGLVDLRISGNRLECLNVEAMSNLADLKRIFLSKNPEFKCPNAVTKFLEDREVSFEKDPEWRNIRHDLVETPGATKDWSTRPINRATTSAYHQKLVSSTQDLYDDYEYETESPDSWPPTVSTERSILPASPNYADGSSRGWPVSSPNPTPDWATAPPPPPPHIPSRNWPTAEPTYRPQSDRPSSNQQPNFSASGHDYEQTSHEPRVIVTSRMDSMEGGDRLTDGNVPPYIESGNLPAQTEFPNNLSPPRAGWSGNSGPVYTEIEYPPIDYTGSISPTFSPPNSDYPSNVHSPMGRPSALPQDYHQPQTPKDSLRPQLLNEIQQVQEPGSVPVVTEIQGPTDKPLPECSYSSSTMARPSFAIITMGILLYPFAKIFNN